MSPADDTPLLRTKLRRPPVVSDVVHRAELHRRLDGVLQRPLGLIVAPAGYGTSTLASHWLEGCGRPGVWLSLDEGDNHLGTFLRYMLAAISPKKAFLDGSWVLPDIDEADREDRRPLFQSGAMGLTCFTPGKRPKS